MSARKVVTWAAAGFVAGLVVAVGVATADSVSPAAVDQIGAVRATAPAAQTHFAASETESSPARVETVNTSVFVTSLPIADPSAENPAGPRFITTEHPDRPLAARSHKRPRFHPHANAPAVPEPTTMLLLATGLAGIAGLRRLSAA